MPLYQYECEHCGAVFEMRRSIKEADEKVECPVCRETACQQVYSGFSRGPSSSSACGPVYHS